VFFPSGHRFGLRGIQLLNFHGPPCRTKQVRSKNPMGGSRHSGIKLNSIELNPPGATLNRANIQNQNPLTIREENRHAGGYIIQPPHATRQAGPAQQGEDVSRLGTRPIFLPLSVLDAAWSSRLGVMPPDQIEDVINGLRDETGRKQSKTKTNVPAQTPIMESKLPGKRFSPAPRVDAQCGFVWQARALNFAGRAGG